MVNVSCPAGQLYHCMLHSTRMNLLTYFSLKQCVIVQIGLRMFKCTLLGCRMKLMLLVKSGVENNSGHVSPDTKLVT